MVGERDFDGAVVNHDGGEGTALAVMTRNQVKHEIEVGLVDARDGQGGRFRVLSDAEVDEHLVALAERD